MIFLTRRFVYLLAVMLAAFCSDLSAQQTPPDPVLDVMQQELARSFRNLKKAPAPPYFLSYQLTDNRAIQVSAEFGALTGSQDHKTRLLDVDLRVGDATLDNTHPVRSAGRMDFEMPSKDAMPIEDDADALRVSLWQETERKYRRAVQQYEQVKANVQVKVQQEDRSKDFSQEPVESYREPTGSLNFDSTAWENRLRKVTAPFAQHKEIVEGEASVTAELETRRYTNSDGSRVQMSSPFYRVIITATAKADDGMLLPLHQTYMSFRPEGLPDEATLQRDVAQMVQTLLALHDAPMADPYRAPRSYRDARARSSFTKSSAIASRVSVRKMKMRHRLSRRGSTSQCCLIFSRSIPIPPCGSWQARNWSGSILTTMKA